MTAAIPVPDPRQAADPPASAVPLLTPGRCPVCGKPYNNRGFCMDEYERVAREKPLAIWVKYGTTPDDPFRKCRNCGKKFVPAARNYVHCPECWAEVGQDYLKKKYGKRPDEPKPANAPEWAEPDWL